MNAPLALDTEVTYAAAAAPGRRDGGLPDIARV